MFARAAHLWETYLNTEEGDEDEAIGGVLSQLSVCSHEIASFPMPEGIKAQLPKRYRPAPKQS